MKIEEKTEGKMKAGGRSLDPKGLRRSPDGAPGSSKGTESARQTAVPSEGAPGSPKGAEGALPMGPPWGPLAPMGGPWGPKLLGPWVPWIPRCCAPAVVKIRYPRHQLRTTRFL